MLITLICCLTELLFYYECNYLSSSLAVCLLGCRVDGEGFLAGSFLMEVLLEVPLEEEKGHIPIQCCMNHEQRPLIFRLELLLFFSTSLFFPLFWRFSVFLLSYTKHHIIAALWKMHPWLSWFQTCWPLDVLLTYIRQVSFCICGCKLRRKECTVGHLRTVINVFNRSDQSWSQSFSTYSLCALYRVCCVEKELTSHCNKEPEVLTTS